MQQFWFELCEKFYKTPIKQQTVLLQSEGISETKRRAFSHYWAKYKKGKLTPDKQKRLKVTKYAAVEEKPVKYIEVRNCLMHRDKCGISWAVLKSRVLRYAAQLNLG